MIELVAVSKEYGNNRQYIARITGRHSKFVFEREFIGRKLDRRTEALVDEPGCYEVTDLNKLGQKDSSYFFVLDTPSGLQSLITDAHDVAMVQKRIESGEQFCQIVQAIEQDGKWLYRILTKVQAKHASVATTVASATEHCWSVLQALPEKEAKAVLAALKLRVSPKPVLVVEPSAEPNEKFLGAPEQ